MKKRKISIKTVIACTAVALTVIACMFSFLTMPARAQDGPVNDGIVRVDLLSDIEDGYDASLSGTVYEIAALDF